MFTFLWSKLEFSHFAMAEVRMIDALYLQMKDFASHGAVGLPMM